MLGSLLRSIEYCVPVLSFFSSWHPFKSMSSEQAIEFDSEVDIIDFVIGNYKNGCVELQ